VNPFEKEPLPYFSAIMASVFGSEQQQRDAEEYLNSINN